MLLFTDDNGPPSDSNRDDWRTYSNGEHGYLIRYPPSWTLTEEPTTCDAKDVGFCVQSIELKHSDEASVFVFVNFQGGWCETSPFTSANVVVSGREGKEYRCQNFTIRSFGRGDSLIRYFPRAHGKSTYLILGQAHLDLTEVEAIIETFQFVD